MYLIARIANGVDFDGASMTIRRQLCLFITISLIFTQTAQAYSLAMLPQSNQQSFSRSSLTSTNGNLTLMANGNLSATGTDLAANAGNMALSAGGSVVLLVERP
jgi:hypothetical protein